jgi:aryl-alcohol dehydrogenase-like predicted oxidoreductase
MIYRPFGKRLGWNVSAIGMGTWNIGNQWGEVDDATSWATVRAAFEAGMNLYDTAEAYGTVHGLSEERLGVALAGMRHRVYIVSKIGHYGRRSGQAVPKNTVDMIRLCAHAILHRLRTDWVDVMLCHEADIADPSIYLETFEALKKQGRIRAHGISTDNIDVLKRYNANGLADVVEVNYSLLNRAAEEQVLPYCQEHGLGVLIRGPLAMGMLSGRYSAATVFTDSIREKWNRDENAKARFLAQAAQVERLKKVLSPGQDMVTAALRFTISHPAAPVSIPGAKDPQQVRMNALAGDRTLTAAEIKKYLAAME